MKIISILIACAMLSLSGCETTTAIWKASTSGVNLSASGDLGVVHDDQIVVRTEQALYIALDTFDLFLKLERQNKELFAKVPKAHEVAENIRRNGRNWIDAAQRAKNAYAHNRTAENHANLLTAYRTLQSAIEESKQFIAKKG